MSLYLPDIDYIKLEWWNSCDLGDILYQTGFIQRMFLACDVGKPKYPIEEEAKKDGNEDVVLTFQKWQKTYQFYVLVTEYQMDALSYIPLHDNIWIYLQNDESARIKDIIINEPEWLDCGCYARLSIEFSIDSKTKSKCCENMVLVDPPPEGEEIELDFFATLPIEANFGISGTSGKIIYIDWGDDTVMQPLTLNGSAQVLSHTYMSADTFTIKISGEIGHIITLNYSIVNNRIERIKLPAGAIRMDTMRMENTNNIAVYDINSSLTTLLSITAYVCKLTTFITLDTFKILHKVDLYGNALTAAAIKTILLSLDANNESTYSPRTLNVKGGTNANIGTWDAGAKAAYCNLLVKGWIILVNGSYSCP